MIRNALIGIVLFTTLALAAGTLATRQPALADARLCETYGQHYCLSASVLTTGT
jgi:hypothetical protein